MSFLVLGGLAAAPVTVAGAEAIETSFPGFAALMNGLGCANRAGGGRRLEPSAGHRGRRPGGVGQEHAGAPAGGRAFRPRLPRYRAALPCRGAGHARSWAAIPATPRLPCGWREALAPEDVEPSRLRGEGIGQNASKRGGGAGGARGAAAVPAAVRRARAAARCWPAATSARSICPDATFKLFVTASDAERARRRFEELRARGDAPIYAAVLEELQERDRRDADRAVAPMRVAPDAWVLDTTSLDAQAAFVAARDSHRGGRLPPPIAPPSLNRNVRVCNPNPGRHGRAVPVASCAPHLSGAGMQEVHPNHRAPPVAGRFRRDAGRDPGLEQSPRRQRRPRHRRRDRRRHRHRRRRPQVRRPRPAQGVRLRPGSRPRSRSATPSRCSSSGSRTRAARSSSAARRPSARRAGTGSSAPSPTPARSRATSSAGSRAASRSTSAVPWPSCRAARSTSGRCATSAR